MCKTVILSDYAYEGFAITLSAAWETGNYEMYRQLIDGLEFTIERMGW